MRALLGNVNISPCFLLLCFAALLSPALLKWGSDELRPRETEIRFAQRKENVPFLFLNNISPFFLYHCLKRESMSAALSAFIGVLVYTFLVYTV